MTKYIAEFSSHVAHELKTPLAILRGESELALRTDHSVEEYRAVLKENLEEITRMSKIVIVVPGGILARDLKLFGSGRSCVGKSAFVTLCRETASVAGAQTPASGTRRVIRTSAEKNLV